MPYFDVTASNLLAGSSVMRTSGAGQGSERLGPSGAAAGTPVAGAWTAFVDRAEQTAASVDGAVGDLASALNLAARAYEIADESAASSLSVGR